MMKDKTNNAVSQTSPEMASPSSEGLSRRQALTRLGIAATVAYVAPTLLHLKSAQASSGGNSSGGSRSSRGKGSKGKKK